MPAPAPILATVATSAAALTWCTLGQLGLVPAQPDSALWLSGTTALLSLTDALLRSDSKT